MCRKLIFLVSVQNKSQRARRMAMVTEGHSSSILPGLLLTILLSFLPVVSVVVTRPGWVPWSPAQMNKHYLPALTTLFPWLPPSESDPLATYVHPPNEILEALREPDRVEQRNVVVSTRVSALQLHCAWGYPYSSYCGGGRTSLALHSCFWPSFLRSPINCLLLWGSYHLVIFSSNLISPERCPDRKVKSLWPLQYSLIFLSCGL
jgi:hypothetical protein